MTKTTIKNGHGGRREGAGRKPVLDYPDSDAVVQMNVRLPVSLKRRLAARGPLNAVAKQTLERGLTLERLLQKTLT